jgi:hypothetical protein
VVSDRRDKEHLPGSVDKEASRHFLGDAATPPRGDARRGLRFSQNDTSKPQMVVSAAKLTWTHVPHEEGNAAQCKGS